jgi:hypothetical protein
MEGLIAEFGEIVDEPSAIQDEIANEAYLNTAPDRITSAKDSAEAALAPLRRLLKEAEAANALRLPNISDGLDAAARPSAFFTLMVAVFGSNREPSGRRARPLVGDCASVNVFQLRKAGLLAEGARGTVELGTGGSQPAVRGPGILTIGSQAIPIRPHAALPVEVFGCPSFCGKDRYRLHFLGGLWACRECHKERHGLDYACRHRKVPGLARIAFLRRRLHADPTPFSPLPAKPPGAWRHLALCREVRRLEAVLLAHARDDVALVLEKRYARRFGR